MYIKHIKIENYRNFNNFEMDFHDGLNVIVGANNSGKTGLLRAIYLLYEPGDISIDDFNKNNLQAHFTDTYKDVPPEIIVEYQIKHEISEEDTEDESIIKLLSFIGMDKINESKASATDPSKYTLIACVKMKYALNSKEFENYIKSVSTVTNFEEYYAALQLFQRYYGWTYTNGISNTTVDAKEATGIFKIDFIEAERKSEAVYSETKHEIEDFLKKDPNGAATMQELQNDLASKMKDKIEPVLTKISDLVENEHNDIGLSKGNVAIAQDLRPSATISGSYVIDVRDTKSNYIVPLSHNGLGYNNLINMYMLVKLVEIQKGKDFRILCLEEPEAHLHPAMQYKLFKFLKKLDSDDNLNQQIFVTTHSSNITAVAGLDNMFMLAYDRSGNMSNCKQQSLEKQFENEQDAKNHMMKFLDVTRSDMLFADKVVFVEGIAEKLLLPKFMEKCAYPYEDDHISIVEIGGKHFEHFIKIFANNPVKKKVLCITDKDFDWKIKEGIVSVTDYKPDVAPCHVTKLNAAFCGIDNLKITYQKIHGSTFEDELFLSNISNEAVACKLLKIALSDTLHEFIDNNKLDFAKWDTNRKSIDGRSQEKIFALIDKFKEAITNYPNQKDDYVNLFFSKLFLTYAKNQKGDIALNILVDEDLMAEISVPQYIKEGIEWLSN